MEDVLTNFPKKALAGLSLTGLSSLVVIEPLRKKNNICRHLQILLFSAAKV